MDFGEAVAQSVDWSAYELMTGESTQFGDTLVRFLRSRDAAECQEQGRDFLNRYLDEKVRQPPDDAQGHEGRPSSPSHKLHSLCGAAIALHANRERPNPA